MGLDTVEILIAVERNFDMRISDEEARKIVTVRDMIDLVYSRVRDADTKVCRTQRAFYRVRNAVGKELGLDRARIRPATRLERLIPIDRRREVWEKLQRAIGAPAWPELKRSSNVIALIGALTIGAAATVMALLPKAFGLALAIACLAGLLAVKATAIWRVQFAHNKATVGQLAEFLAPDLPNAWRPARTGWTHEKVRLVVRGIVVEHLNVSPDFSDESAFVADLGAD